jgi:hypothetical protein
MHGRRLTREMLDRRFDELESGKVQPIDGEDAYRRLMESTELHRRQRPDTAATLEPAPGRVPASPGGPRTGRPRHGGASEQR